jgi:protein tyrosine/serine phosphatase
MRSLLQHLYNWHPVTVDVSRSAQPYLGFRRAFLRSTGARSIVNLRGENPDWRWWHKEKAAARSEGIGHVDIRMSSRLIPARVTLAQLFQAFETAPKPLLLKCSGGQDRTGLAAGLYLVHAKGWGALAEAKSHLRFLPYLHHPKARQVWMGYFLDFAMENARGRPIAAWAREDYRPEDFAAYLQRCGVKGGYTAIQSASQQTPLET